MSGDFPGGEKGRGQKRHVRAAQRPRRGQRQVHPARNSAARVHAGRRRALPATRVRPRATTGGSFYFFSFFQIFLPPALKLNCERGRSLLRDA